LRSCWNSYYNSANSDKDAERTLQVRRAALALIEIAMDGGRRLKEDEDAARDLYEESLEARRILKQIIDAAAQVREWEDRTDTVDSAGEETGN
jgi:lipid-binding SYLF domain-containing protein